MKLDRKHPKFELLQQSVTDYPGVAKDRAKRAKALKVSKKARKRNRK